MIGYGISQAELEAKIEAAVPGWLKRAHDRTDAFRTAGAYDEKSPIWSEVKPVYLKLQGECKCAFCERKIGSLPLCKIEFDVEHFRPKGHVKPWKASKETAQELADMGMAVAALAGGGGAGYHLLPYHPFNYAAACKPCNSVLKGDYFPIAGAYSFADDNPAALLAEEPLLIYPIGNFDCDPEQLIQFTGVSPKAVAADDYGRARAKVTIEFFLLDDVNKRRDLLDERCLLIIALYPQLEKLAANPANAKVRRFVTNRLKPSARHANCARSFKRLFDADPATAETIFQDAFAQLDSKSP